MNEIKKLWLDVLASEPFYLPAKIKAVKEYTAKNPVPAVIQENRDTMEYIHSINTDLYQTILYHMS